MIHLYKSNAGDLKTQRLYTVRCGLASQDEALHEVTLKQSLVDCPRCLSSIYAEAILRHVATCNRGECMACGMLTCPDGEPGHYWKDGCPVCHYPGKERPDVRPLGVSHPYGPMKDIDPRFWENFEGYFVHD